MWTDIVMHGEMRLQTKRIKKTNKKIKRRHILCPKPTSVSNIIY